MNRRIKRTKDIAPDEIFIDSHNLPEFDTQQFEGRLDKPISRLNLLGILVFFILVLLAFELRIWNLQVKNGQIYNNRSENNRLRNTPIFAARGVIYDRNGIELAWNAPSQDPDIALRRYKGDPGLAHVIGYVQYPSKDKAGFYYREDFLGMDGVEKYFNSALQGVNGINLVEVDAAGRVQSQNVTQPPKEGSSITLSIDSRVQSEMHKALKDISEKVGFAGGAGIIMDTTNGEILAMTSYPEYDSETMSSKVDQEKIRSFLNDKNKPFLDRVIDGLYTPGSIIKPYVALAALNEKIIDPYTKILSTGSISIQNQYYPTLQTVFKDWKAHGWVDMRHALSVSSDVYFYEIGGGYKTQKGLGISRIEKYMKMFGFGEKVENSFFTGQGGVIPSPEWKKANFNGEAWTLGNTYHTSIGQYGFQTSPLQIVRAMSAIVNNGAVRDPSIIKGEVGKLIKTADIPARYYDVIKEGMRLSVTEGTGQSLNVPYVDMATKSGTAELGTEKANVNSWMTGYFPYKNPRYAFAILLEKGSVHNVIGAGSAMREVIDWMNVNTPEYFR
jgi:penicillin-binding protein 2